MVICLERDADLHMAQLMPLPLAVSCFSKIQIGLPFWYRLTRVVSEKGPLNGCVCVWILDLCNVIVKEGSIPEDWKSSVVQPIYKGKGDPMECGSYRGIKLLEHAMIVVERIFAHRIRQQIETDDMQFGFMKGKGTTDAIFMKRQMHKNFRVKDKKLYLVLWIWRKLLIGCQEK